MNYQKLLREVMSLLFVVLVSSVCTVSLAAPVPQGQVRGVLIDEQGHPLSDREFDVFLATIIDEASGKVQLNTSWKSTLDDSGAFLIEGVPSGKYCLVIFFQQKGVFGGVLNENELLVFEITQDSGVDLGRVDASQIRLF